jgi:hypothetical protein
VSCRRGRRLEEKESRRWLSLVERVDSEIPEVPAAIHVMDREAGAYELLAALRREPSLHHPASDRSGRRHDNGPRPHQ